MTEPLQLRVELEPTGRRSRVWIGGIDLSPHCQYVNLVTDVDGYTKIALILANVTVNGPEAE